MPGRRQWLIQAACGLGVLIIALDTGVITISVYTVSQYFNIDAATAAWLPLMNFLTVTSTLLLFGRVADLLGSKRVFTGGLGIYALSSLAGGFANSFPLLLVLRGLQALGISMISTTAAAILTENVPPSRRGTALGINSTCVGIGSFVGPVLAGYVIKLLGWRYVFFSVVPLALLALALAATSLPRSRAVRGGRFDFVGALLFAVGAVSLLLAIDRARTGPLASLTVLGLAVVAALSIATFVVVELRAEQPILDLKLFRVPLLSLSLASSFALFLGVTGQDLLTSLFVQQVMLLDPLVAGLAISVVPFVRMVVASPSGVLSDRFGSRGPSVFGCVSAGLGILGLSLMDASTGLSWLVLYLSLIGLGMGLFLAPNMHAIMASVPPNRLAMGAGMLGMRRNVGQSISIALAVYLMQVGSGGSSATVSGFQLAFSVEAACLAVAAVAAVMAGTTRLARRPAPARQTAN